MEQIKEIRHFNRAFARALHVFSPRALGLEYTLAEVRIIEEIALHKNCTANFLCQYLSIDKGYMSHILTRLADKGLLTRKPYSTDHRKLELCLTAEGLQLFAQIDERSNTQMRDLLQQLSPEEITTITKAMQTILQLLPEGK